MTIDLSSIGAVDTMIGFPHPDMAETYRFITVQTHDRESKEDFEFPAEYMFKDVPEKGLRDVEDPVATTMAEMDRWGIQWGLIGVGEGEDDTGVRALRNHPDRFVASANADPNDGMDGIRRIKALHAEHDIRAVGCF